MRIAVRRPSRSLIALGTALICLSANAADPAPTVTPAKTDRERLIVNLVVAGLADSSSFVREESYRRLKTRELPADLVTAALAKAVKDADENIAPDVLRSYAEMLSTLGPEAAGATEAILKQLQPDAPLLRAAAGPQMQGDLWAALARIGVPRKALPLIEEALKSDSPSRIGGGARAAGTLGPAAGAVVPLLTAALKLDAADVTLDRFFTPLSLSDAALRHGHGATTPRREVVEALGRIGPAAAPAIPLLRQIAQDRSKDPATLEDALAAIKALEDLGKVGREAFMKERANLLKGAQVGIGQPVPNLPFTDFQGKPHRFREGGNHPVLMVFVETECPCVPAYDDRMKALYRRFRAKGLRIIYLFANPRDSDHAIKRFLARGQYPWITARDKDGTVARLFQARVATEACLVDGDGRLRYRGRIDDNVFDAAAVKERSLENAIAAVLGGRPIARPETAALGCAFPNLPNTP